MAYIVIGVDRDMGTKKGPVPLEDHANQAIWQAGRLIRGTAVILGAGKRGNTPNKKIVLRVE